MTYGKELLRRSVQCYVLGFSNRRQYVVIVISDALQNILLQNLLRFFVISFLQFEISISESNPKAVSIFVWPECFS